MVLNFPLSYFGAVYLLIVSVDKGDKGKPSVDASHCNLSIGDIDVSFHGGARYGEINLLDEYLSDGIVNVSVVYVKPVSKGVLVN